VANWSNNNKFQLNSGKCKELRINFTKDPCRDEPVKVNDKHFEVVTSAKILGMTITDDLKWNVHVANILLKASNSTNNSTAPVSDLSSNTLVRPFTQAFLIIFQKKLNKFRKEP
jgi:hypothetical protein